MKINYTKIIAYWFLLMWSIVTVLYFTSCQTPNAAKQKKHFDKFIYYGGKVDTVKQTITKEVLVKGKDGEDSLVYVTVEVECKQARIEYKDRWHIKQMDKAERDSMKHVEALLRLQLKDNKQGHKADGKALAEQTKQIAIEHKADKIKAIRGLIFAIGFVLLLIAAIIFMIKR